MRSLLVSAWSLLSLSFEVAGLITPVAGQVAARDQVYYTPTGEEFAVEYNHDHPGGDFDLIFTESFDECINRCAAAAPCRAVAYEGEFCWLKSSVDAAVTSSRVNSAVRLNARDQVYYAPNGEEFAVEYNHDYQGGDFDLIFTESFDECINRCAAAAPCRAVAYEGEFCWLKSSVDAAITSSQVNGAVRLKYLPSPVPCPADGGNQVKEASGRDFTVQCGTDHPGGDMKSELTPTFGECIALCDETEGCVAAAWWIGICYMKNTLLTANASPWVDSAVLSSLLAGPPLCPGENGQQIQEPSGNYFTIACATDRPGGDMATKLLDSFRDCIAWCDETPGCIAAAHRDGQCWMKNTLTLAQGRHGCEVAVLSSKLSSSTSSKVSSTTSSKQSTLTTVATTTSATSSSQSVSASTASSTATTVLSSTASGSLSSSTLLSSTASGSLSSSTLLSSTASGSPSSSTTATSTGTSTTSTGGSVQTTTTSSVSAPSGTAGTPTGPITLAAQTTVTLGPLAPPNINMAGTDVLTPQEVSQLWFGNWSSGSNASDVVNVPTVRMNVTFEYSSIVLDNSIDIINVQCGTSNLSADFNGTAAYEAAKTSWAATQGNSSELILITAAPGCSSDGHYIYFVANSCDFNDGSQSVTCAGDVESIADIAQEVGLDFGSISYPPSVASNPELESAYGCFQPSSAEIDGLPAIYCGPDFDERLDNQLGFYSGADADFNATLAALAPGTTLSTPNRRHMIQRRCFLGLCSVFDKVEGFITNTWNAAIADLSNFGQDLQSMADKLFNEAENSLSNIGGKLLSFAETVATGVVALTNFLTTLDLSLSFDFPLDLSPPSQSLDMSPWGPGYSFYNWTPATGAFYNEQQDNIDKIQSLIIGDADPKPGVELWCINCGIQGDLTVTGSIAYTLINGLTKGQVSMNGNLYAGFFLGLNAFSQWQMTDESDFLTRGVYGFSIPDIIAVGPSLAVGISVDLDIPDIGQLFLGTDLSWPALSATLDFVHPAQSSLSGWTPTANDTVQADGSLTMSSTLGLPITLGFGLNLLNGKYEKEIKLVDTPGVQASLQYEYTNGSVNSAPPDGCEGIDWTIGLVNTVVLDLSQFGGGTYSLDEWDAPAFASSCISESLTIAAPTTTVTSLPSGTSSVPTITPVTYPDCSTFDWKAIVDLSYCESNGETFQFLDSSSLSSFNSQDPLNLCVNSLSSCVDECSGNYYTGCVGATISLQANAWCFTCALSTKSTDTVSGTEGLNHWTFIKVTPPSRKRADFVERAITTTSTSSISDITATGSGTTAQPSPTGNVSSITITDATGQLLVNPHVNGSLFISAANSTTALTNLTSGITFVTDSTDSAVLGDSTGRLMYYFPGTIAAVGASRLRLGSWGSIPEGAELVTLFPTVSSTGGTVLVAVDSSLRVFSPFVCDIEGQLNKIFLVNDASNGSSILTNPHLTYTVIGGVAQQCLSLGMVAQGLPGFTRSTAPTTPTASPDPSARK